MDLYTEYAKEIEAFVSVCHQLSRLLYVTGHGGNLAWKLRPGVILITPTQMNKGAIQAADLVFINESGERIAGTRRSTGETPMYVNFFRERPDINTVIHCHPPLTGAFAITKGVNWLMRPVFPETTTEVGPAPVVPYGEPLTQRLADNFLPFLSKYNAFLMENHGLVILSPRDISWAMMMTELLEQSAASILAALAIGDIKEISREDLQNLDNILKIRGLPLFGAPGVHKSLLEVYA